MNILVTGGAGYIGSHTCKELARAGFTPITYDNLSTGNRWAVKWGPLEEGDIADRQRLYDVLRRYTPCAVIHFAAFAYVGESVHDPEKYYRNNVVGTLALLETMRMSAVNKIVFSSTCATYGVPSEIPISETHSQNPVNPYGSSKLIIERILQDYDLAYGFTSISLRYFNAAGADLDCEIGEAHEPETHLIPLALKAATQGSSVLSVNGVDYDTIDGTCVRDFVHVSDLARAHVLALTRILAGGGSNQYNLGNGIGFSVKQVLSAVERVTGNPVRTEYGLRRLGDPALLIANPNRAIKELGWRSQITDIDQIIDSAWTWFLKTRSSKTCLTL
jgi:UDP-arabinose 4-epimerase